MFGKRRRQVTQVEFARYEHPARTALAMANQYALQAKQPQILTEHLTCALVSPGVREHLARFVPTFDDVARLLADRGAQPGTVEGPQPRPFADDVRAIITATFTAADAEGRQQIGPEHLLLALLDRPDTPGARLLLDLGVDPARDPASWRVTDEGGPRPGPSLDPGPATQP